MKSDISEFHAGIEAGPKDRYHYGLLTPKLFQSIIAEFSELRRQGQAVRPSRDDQDLT
jgi:hypothetical protein